MDRLLIVGRKSVAKDLLVSLQSLGVVQVVPLEGEELSRFELKEGDAKARDNWDGVVARSEGLIDTLSIEAGASSKGESSQQPHRDSVVFR